MKKHNRKKRVVVSVTSDLVCDNRVHKSCLSLVSAGFDILLIGRIVPSSMPMKPRPYSTRRMRLLFKKGPLFYACYNIRLFFLLLFIRVDFLLANDLDTLLANVLISKVRRKPIIYDSHEYFTEVPELISRPRIKKIWEQLESVLIRHVTSAYTVSDSIAGIYKDKYNIHFEVVRNLPFATPSDSDILSCKKMIAMGSIPKDHIIAKVIPAKLLPALKNMKIILYQGALNCGRGVENLIRSMQFISDATLIIAGDGDITQQLIELRDQLNLKNRVLFTGRISLEEIVYLTPCADVGVSIEEDLGLNYLYALPNKLFDYIQARVPVLVSALPEMVAVTEKFQIGEITASHNPLDLAGILIEMLTNEEKRVLWRENLEEAAATLTWENEQKHLINMFLR